MSKSLTSESLLSKASGLSGRYEVICPPFTSERRDSATAAERRETTTVDNGDTCGITDFIAKPLPWTGARTEPPTLQPVRHGSVPRAGASSLASYGPLQHDRQPTANSSRVNTVVNGSPVLGGDDKSIVPTRRRQAEKDGRSERHRRYSQALQTPLTDDSSVALSVRTICHFSNPSKTAALPTRANAQSAQKESGCGSSRVIAPSTTSVASAAAAAARGLSGGRLEPLLHRKTDANSASDVVTLATEATGRTCTPAEPKYAPSNQLNTVASAPSNLPGGMLSNSGNGKGSRSGRVTNTSFLREPLPRSSVAAAGHHNDGHGADVELSSWGRGTPVFASARTGAYRDEYSRRDSALLHYKGIAMAATEPARTSPHPTLTLFDKGGRPEVRDLSSGSSPTQAIPHNARSGASRSGSGVFSMHTLVSRNKNVDNFDYGLSALGFPVESAKQQPQHQHLHEGSVSPGSPGAIHSGTESFLVANSALAEVEHRGSGLMHATMSPNDVTAITNTMTHSNLPSLLLVNKQSGALQHHQSSHNAAGGVVAASSASSTSAAGNSAQQPPLVPLMRHTSGGGDSAIPSALVGNAAGASLKHQPQQVQQQWHAVAESTRSTPSNPPRLAPCGNNGVGDSAAILMNNFGETETGNEDSARRAEKPVRTKANVTPPRPPPFAQDDAAQLKSLACTSQVGVSESPRLRFPDGTRAGLCIGYDEVATPVSLASNTGTLASGSNGSSGALASVSLRSIVLQPRQLPRNLGNVLDLRGGSPSDTFELPNLSGGRAGIGHGNSNSNGGVSGSRASHTQPMPRVGAPDKLSPKLVGRSPALPDSAADELVRDIDRDTVLAPVLVRHNSNTNDNNDIMDDEGDGDSLLFGNDSNPSDVDDDRNSSDNEGHGATRSKSNRTVQTLQSPVRRTSKKYDAVGRNSNFLNTTNVVGERSNGRQAYETDAAATERQLDCGSHETFLPFDEVSAVGSRGFSSLMLTSFLRHAGSSEAVWTPTSSSVVWSHHPAGASISSSPPSSMAATVTGIMYDGCLCASNSSQMSAPVASTNVKVESSGQFTSNDEAPLSVGEGDRDGTVTATRRSASATATTVSSLRGAPATTVATVPGLVLRVPAPPRMTSLRTLGKGPPERAAFGDDVSSVCAAEQLPPELVKAGILRWAKPLSAPQVIAEDKRSVNSAASSSPLTREHLLQQLELSNHGAWQDVRGLSILEHRSPAPTAATRVFAVDEGYAIRVVQNDLIGDCETDECVERCAAVASTAAVTTPSGMDSKDGTKLLPPLLTLPSVLVDSAIQHFFESGENAIVLIMDTASTFALESSGTTKTMNRVVVTSGGTNSGNSPARKDGAAKTSSGDLNKDSGCIMNEMNAARSTGVVYAMCRKVVEAFSVFKGAHSNTQPNLIADLKMAVAFVPVPTDTFTFPSTSGNTNTMKKPLCLSTPAQFGKSVFYDAVSRASLTQDSRRSLEVATSPIFGTCLNGCQWLVVEDESDISAAFGLLSGLFSELQGQEGFLYIQFLHQCFIPGAVSTVLSGGDATTAGIAGASTVMASRDVAGFAHRGKKVLASSGGAQAAGAQLNGAGSNNSSCHLDDIVVSSFTIAFSCFPQVFELVLDQRAGTPWSLLRYALGKGPSTVLGVVRVHEEDEDAAYPLSLLQRMKALQHPRPRRGSVRTFVFEQRNKISDLKRRLADAEYNLRRTTATAAARGTMKRLSVLISKLECSTKDAEDFLLDPEYNHVPVYVNARCPPVCVMSEENNKTNSSNTNQTLNKQLPQSIPSSLPHAPHSPSTPKRVTQPALRSLLVRTGEPLFLAMVQNYDPCPDIVAGSDATATERKDTARWILSAVDSSSASQEGRRRSSSLSSVSPAQGTLTAWLTSTKYVPLDVDEVTSLSILRETAAQQLPTCETWRRVGAHFQAGCNATAVVVQEKMEESILWSLRVSLEVVHGILKNIWSAPHLTATSPTMESDTASKLSALTTVASTSLSHEVTRVAVSAYHVSGFAVADLLRNSSTSSMITDRSAARPVAFTQANLGVRPLSGTAVPLNVTYQVAESLPQLETILRDAVERLRAAQKAVKCGDDTPGEDSAVDLLTRRCLTAPGYTVMTVELTQRIVQRVNNDNSSSSNGGADDEDIYVSSLSMIDLGCHFSLLRDATEASAAPEKATGVGGGNGVSSSSPNLAAMLLARLLVKRRDLVVCAAALPAVPTAATAYGLLSSLKEFQQNATRVPHVYNTPPPCSVRRLITHLQSIVAQTESNSSLANVRNALKQAHAVLLDPYRAAFVSYPYTQSDAEAMTELPSVSQLEVDSTVLLRISSLLQNNNTSFNNNNTNYNNASSTITTAGTVSTIGGSGSSPEVSTVPDGSMEKSTNISAHPQQHDVAATEHYAAERLTSSRESTAADQQQQQPGTSKLSDVPRRTSIARGCDEVATETARRNQDGGKCSCSTDAKEKEEVSNLGGTYYGVHYRGHDAVLMRRDLLRHVAHQNTHFPQSGSTGMRKSTPAARTRGALTRAKGEADAEDDGSDGEGEASEPVLMPSVVVLNASTTGAYVERHGTRVRVPLPSSSGVQFASFNSDEVVNIKPTSMGMKSSLLTRVVSCVSRGRTAALLISDTESCDAASCIAWLTLRTVMGGVFQSLKMKEVEGVQHCAVLRAFLIEENRENEFADLLAPRLTAAQPRHLLTRLKHSPFCGPLPADATARLVKDLQDVNAALSSVLAAAWLAHQSTNTTTATRSTSVNMNEPLHGAIVLQLTFHQFIPSTATEPADVVVSSLWCVQLGCCAGWMEALQAAPNSATATLLQYWMGGPCYTTSVAGFSRFVGVRASTWRELLVVQRQLGAVPLLLPRPGSVRAYIAVLLQCLQRVEESHMSKEEGGGRVFAEDKGNMTSTTSANSSVTSTPKKVDQISKSSNNGKSKGGSNNAVTSTDSIMRVTALLREAQRMVTRGLDARKSLQLPGQLAHEAKTFAAFD